MLYFSLFSLFKAAKREQFIEQAVNFWNLLPQDAIERNNISKWKGGLNELRNSTSMEYLAGISPGATAVGAA